MLWLEHAIASGLPNSYIGSSNDSDAVKILNHGVKNTYLLENSLDESDNDEENCDCSWVFMPPEYRYFFSCFEVFGN